MIAEQLLVGGLAVALGVSAVAAAILNWEWSYQLRKTRWIESMWGRGGVRVFYALLGTALIALGIAIAMGFGPNKSIGGRGNDNRSGRRDLKLPDLAANVCHWLRQCPRRKKPIAGLHWQGLWHAPHWQGLWHAPHWPS